MKVTSMCMAFSLALVTLIVLPISAAGEEERRANDGVFRYTAPECPEYTDTRAAYHGTDLPISYLSYIFPSAPELMSIRTIAYQLCNLEIEGLDVTWQGPNLATGYGNPLIGGMCISRRRVARGSAPHDTFIAVRQDRSDIKTVPAHMQCGYQSIADRPALYLWNSLWSVYQDKDEVRAYSLSYSVTVDENNENPKMTITWWPTDLEIVIALDNSLMGNLDAQKVEGDGVKVERLEAEDVVASESDKEVMRYLYPELPEMSDAFFFWAFRKVEQNERGDGVRASVPILLSVDDIEQTIAPVFARIAGPEGEMQIVLVAEFDGIRVESDE